MIGLGSNRLTVCRRGGMSVTQAGRGGMEWLAGVRYPSWAQWWLPYSRQAGEALLAQFPTQWPTIRDYGFAHPEIVGYMNAYAPEDAKIAYSLVEGIGIRYISGTGTQYMNSGIQAQAGGYAKIKFRVTRKNNTYPYIFGGDNRNVNPMRRWSAWLDGTQIGLRLGMGNSYPTPSVPNSLNKWYELDVSNGKVLLNGTQISTYTPLTSSPGYDIFIFGTNSENQGVTVNGAPMEGDMAFIELEGHRFVPYIKNNVKGMIDLATGAFKPNLGSGSFTISETPAS